MNIHDDYIKDTFRLKPKRNNIQIDSVLDKAKSITKFNISKKNKETKYDKQSFLFKKDNIIGGLKYGNEKKIINNLYYPKNVNLKNVQPNRNKQIDLRNTIKSPINNYRNKSFQKRINDDFVHSTFLINRLVKDFME